jgi:hypothetical protein
MAEQAEQIGGPTQSAALFVLLLMLSVKLPFDLTFVLTLSTSVELNLKFWD